MSQFITNDYNMTFSSGVECASFVASSNLLRRPVDTILELYAETSPRQEDLCFKVKQDSDLTVIAFVASQINLQAPQRDLVSSSALKDNNFPLFDFLCNHKFPCFSLHEAAISLFYNHRDQLHQLKSQIDSSKPLMVTGHALGGSIASLFTLALLDNLTISSGRKHSPLCVTFGSPLLGDTDLQKAISRSPFWNSCFLHVASLQDPLPRSFVSTNVYKPFGTFLLCSELGSACLNNPESILELLGETSSTTVSDPYDQAFNIHQYSDIVQNLNHKAICKVFTSQPQNTSLCDSLEATIIIQLAALGLSQIQQDVVEKLKLREITLQKKKKDLDPSKRLNDMKMYMANLEWYKKYAKAQETGMYDMYKHRNERDHDIVWWKKELTLYWREMVEEAEMKPQKEGAAFRTRWLFAGTNYRRMMEPLDIADYYESGGKDYETEGRSKHYRQLEEWLKEDRRTPSSGGLLCTTNKQNVESILTLDSCFWARVEEALIACIDMKKSGEESSRSKQKLSEFEEYVYGLLKNYAVSPEIFFKHSTYMRWWNEYQMLKEASSDSKLASFMRNPENYKLYSIGLFDFQ